MPVTTKKELSAEEMTALIQKLQTENGQLREKASEAEQLKMENRSMQQQLDKHGEKKVEVVTKTYKCKTGPLKGKEVRFKPGHVALKLPADLKAAVVESLYAGDEAKQREFMDAEVFHAKYLIELPQVMELLAERKSGMIEVVK